MHGMNAMNALIFGANSQDGHYLSQICSSQGLTPVGIARTSGFLRADVANYVQVRELVRQYQPEYIFHLAAASTTRHEALFENHQTISTGTVNILEAVKTYCPRSRIFLTGSGLQFVNTGMPISEKNPFEALSPYAVARIQSVYAGRYFRSLGLAVYFGYLFHHESPLRKPNHVSKMITLAARRIAAGSAEKIELGDISVEKEWTFAGDVTRAMLAMVRQDTVFEAVIGSGVTYTIGDWLEQCFGIIGKDWREHVRIREGFVPEYKRLVSDPATIRSLGWAPRVSFPELARMMMSSTEGTD
jgi:GDPmannose 4,6-dehydratase